MEKCRNTRKMASSFTFLTFCLLSLFHLSLNKKCHEWGTSLSCILYNVPLSIPALLNKIIRMILLLYLFVEKIIKRINYTNFSFNFKFFLIYIFSLFFLNCTYSYCNFFLFFFHILLFSHSNLKKYGGKW